MYCGKCGAELAGESNYCPKCGNPINQPQKTSVSETTVKIQEPGRGTLILILGILGFFFGPITGIPAWVMGSGDLKKIKYGIIAFAEKAQTKAGMILGIITTIIIPFLVIIGIAVVVGINIFNASSIQANRDAVISDLTNLASISQMYYRKPAALGGGNNSFIGWDIPERLKTTENGEYFVEEIQSNSLTLVGVGHEKGNDGENKIRVVMIVSYDSISSTQIVN